MLLTICGIFFALSIVCVVIDMRNRKERIYYEGESGWTFVGIICIGVAIVLLAVICCMSYDVIPESNIIDNKIAMYEEENARIEATIEDMVSGYMEYETGVIDKVLNNGNEEENAIVLVSLFPELKSDTLVQKQLDVFFANNEKIKELKAKKIDLSMKRWIIYFGN